MHNCLDQGEIVSNNQAEGKNRKFIQEYPASPSVFYTQGRYGKKKADMNGIHISFKTTVGKKSG
jgi:hypothetical protein